MTKKITAANLSAASFTASEAGAFLPLAAQAAIKGKAEIDSAKAKGAAALAVMTAGFASDEAATRAWAFDIMGKDSVHDHVETCGFADMGNTSAAWARNGEGAISKVAQSAYKAAFQNTFFNLPEPNAAVWTMASKAVAMARAIREEGMTATIEGGALKLEGGAGEKADAMRGAKSLSALAKVAKGEEGTNREGHGNAKGEGETRAATPEEITRAAVALVKIIAKGESTACNATLSNLREIARLVAKHPEAFAED